MIKMKGIKTAVLTFVLIVAGIPMLHADFLAPTRHASEPNNKSVKSRLDNVDRLVRESSVSDRIKSSGNEEAEKIRQEAIGYHAQAQDAYGQGKIVEANALLGKATITMFKAMRLAGSGSALAGKYKDDYESRKSSLDALIGAMTHVAREKSRQQEISGVQSTIDRISREAEALATKGGYKKARKLLDSAYDMAKVELEKLRGGDTLVRSLNFSSPEEEYEYELDRNDTHRMLVRVLLEEKRGKKSVDKMVINFMDKADVLRKQAEDQAKNHDFKSAISTLEASTKEIVRAIRSAGIYIPG